MLTVTGLAKSFGSRRVLESLDLRVAPGEVVSLLGANGSGKSTALKCIVGLHEPDAGTVSVDGGERPGDRSDGRDGAARRVAMVFQQIHLVRRRTALENVCAGALGRLPLSRSWSTWAVPADVREEAMACLAKVGLADRAHERAGALSGGQQQRVALARALCQRADVLLADEPVSALDPSAAEHVLRVMTDLARSESLAVVTVLHQPELARRHSDRLVGLLGGRVVFDRPAADVTPDSIGHLYAPPSNGSAA